MASKQREELDVLSLSFTDVLTCVLGASIALFLIFVAIVKLTSTDSLASGSAKAQWNKTARSIQKQMDQGFATASLRIVTTNKALLDSILVQSNSGNAQRSIQISHQNATYYGVLVHFAQGLKTPVKVVSQDIDLTGELAVQLTVGGLPQFCTLQVKRAKQGSQNIILDISKQHDLYLKFANASGFCEGRS
ncbi:hypothetical protein AAEU32_03675 [Pseudoalteromonas sp. SSDWG2]|uniref:hypothetical protein n=1 Tax=Pseudoalteromonas sp. SSDWG2 TaxID=3139391 RepID=UPI003BAD3497